MVIGGGGATENTAREWKTRHRIAGVENTGVSASLV